MNKIKTMSIVVLSLMVMWLAGCEQGATKPIPAGTVASINFKDKQLIVVDKAGKAVKPVKDDRKGKTVFEATIRFKKVNPCYFEFCPAGSACILYKISDGPCPSGF